MNGTPEADSLAGLVSALPAHDASSSELSHSQRFSGQPGGETVRAPGLRQSRRRNQGREDCRYARSFRPLEGSDQAIDHQEEKRRKSAPEWEGQGGKRMAALERKHLQSERDLWPATNWANFEQRS
jgi:hypothetical protein